MKKAVFSLFIISLLWAFWCNRIYYAHSNQSAAPLAKTGAPGEGECTDCHFGVLNPDSGSVNVNFFGEVAYSPGGVYSVEVNISQTMSVYGFSLVALDANGANAGSFNLTNTSNTKTASTAGKTYISHKDAVTQNTSSWSFEWVAPNTSMGDVIFYASGNAANGDGGTAGDKVYTTMDTLTGPPANLNESSVSDIRVFPNPFSTCIFIEANLFTDTRVKIFNISGSLVYEKPYTNENIKLENLDKGIYIIRIYNEERYYSKKLIKL